MKIEFIVFNGGSINYYCYSASYRQIREQRMIASNGFEWLRMYLFSLFETKTR